MAGAAVAAAHVRQRVGRLLLLMVINLVAITSTSLPQHYHHHHLDEHHPQQQQQQLNDALRAAGFISARRAVRSIDDGRAAKSSVNAGEAPKNKPQMSKNPQRSGSVFTTENSTVVWAQIGGTASLSCGVKKNSGTVLWLREWESAATPTLLSVGVNKHTADDRYYVEHIRHLQNWGLVIKPVRVDDAGTYKCQVSTHPPTVILVQLKVTKAYAEIVGAPDLHLRAGSEMHLQCEIRLSTEPPAYVFWYHDERMINYEPGVSVHSVPSSNHYANVLVLADADKSHDGNYTCKPSNAVPAYINVHVLNSTEEENPAAMLHANTSPPRPSMLSFLHLLVAIVMTVAWNQR